MEALVAVLVFWAGVGGLVGFAIGSNKGRGAEGFWLGFLLGVIGWIIVAVMAPSPTVEAERTAAIAAALRASADERPVGATRECPWCAETIKAAARVCRYCGRDVEPAPPEEIEREEIEFVRDEFPAAFDRGYSMLVGLPHPPAHAARWLRELCKRIEAGSPPAAAVERIPLDWEGPAPRKPPSVAAAVGVGDPAAAGEYPDVAAEFPAAYDQARALLAGLEPPPDHPAAWLRELCQRIDAGSPPEAAAARIPLDWR